jgi:hypothetical protein
MVKKVCILFLITLQMSLHLMGQAFHGGLEAGFVASEVSGDNLAGPNKPGLYVAAYTFTSITSSSDLMLKIMYIQKGSRSIPTEKNNFNEYKFYLQYLEVPLIYQFDISPFTNMQYIERLKIHSGLSVSVLVNHFESENGSTNFQPGEKADFHPAELNLLVGFSFPLSPSIDFRFGFSNALTPLRPHAGGRKIWYNQGQYNTAWTFGLTWLFW